MIVGPIWFFLVDFPYQPNKGNDENKLHPPLFTPFSLLTNKKKTNPNLENTWFDTNMLAAFDDVVNDSVDIISMLIGTIGRPPMYSFDSMSIRTFY